ncbi:hypothetical protein [Aestuariivivens sediminicola]|uniref:hypothetical protein n=1 Tax=Aestuariivivens sediminicola TaxID=2913560 RepID=UPI001F55BD16|nr:hypothetical protein [Aestuariivivens sediminicola]
MPTVSFLYRSRKDFAPLTMRFEHKAKQYHVTTKYPVSRNDFKTYYRKKNTKTGEDKIQFRKAQDFFYKELNDIEEYVLKQFYKLDDESIISKNWLKKVYDNYLNPGNQSTESHFVTYWFDYKIDNHHKFINSNKTYGLSPDRLKGLRNIKEIVIIYELERLNRKLKLVCSQSMFTS